MLLTFHTSTSDFLNILLYFFEKWNQSIVLTKWSLLLENGFAITILENVEIKDYRKIGDQKTKNISKNGLIYN